MTTICLNMIVKDEAHIIRQTLESVCEYIDDFVIVDTGSTDATVEVVDDFMRRAEIPGTTLRRPWKDFGHNRSEALELARHHSISDYFWVIDADDIVVGTPDIANLKADAYRMRYGPSFEYWRLQLFARSKPWRYRGVLHEYPACEGETVTGSIGGDYHVVSRRLGGRSQRSDKYLRDAQTLEAALRGEPDSTRYAFYLAQSYFDAGLLDNARRCYRDRIDMGGWDQELFYSRYRVAQCLDRLGAPWQEVRNAYLETAEVHPDRAEPLVYLASRERGRGDYAAAYRNAERAAAIPYPAQDSLFIQADVYQYRARDEQALAAYYLGKHREALELNTQILAGDCLSDAERARIETNRGFAVDAIAAQPVVRDGVRVHRLCAKQPADSPAVTLTITSCKRLDLFIKTVDSLLANCTDVERVDRWVCVDDNSSHEDRREMQRRFPFFEFIFKTPEQRGHALSMNLLLDTVTTPFWLHLEDDWNFVDRLPLIGQAIEILAEEPQLGQVLFNRHYAEDMQDRALVGGELARTESGLRFVRQLFLVPGSAQEHAFWQQHPGCRSNILWPHYSLRPSLLRTEAVKSLGRFDESAEHFELEMARRYTDAGWRSAFLDTICCLHTGRLVRERHDSSTPNAYALNEMPQFGEVRTPAHEIRRQAHAAILPSRKYQLLRSVAYQRPLNSASSDDPFSWRALDELSRVAYEVGEFGESFEAYRELLLRRELPPEERERIEANLGFTLDRLPPPDTVVINLDRRTDRLAAFRERADAAKLNFWRRFPAIDGRQLELSSRIDHLFRGNRFGSRRTVIACALSHIEVWRSARQMTMVLEDDVELVDGFRFKLACLQRDLEDYDPEWHVLLLARLSQADLWQPQRPVVHRHPELRAVDWHSWIGGTAGYLVSPRGAARLLRIAETDGMQDPVDTYLQTHSQALNIYESDPPIAYAEIARTDGESDTDIQYDYQPLG